MFALINKWIASYYKKHTTKRGWKKLPESIYENIFKQNGEGLYIVNVQGKSNTFSAKIIEYFSGKLTHSFVALYSENLQACFTSEEWNKLNAKWNYYYGVNSGITPDIKVLVLCSADSDGMNYLDYGNYATRIQSIRKAPIPTQEQQQIIKYLISDKVMKANYDYTGLFFYLIKCGDSKTDLYCSEVVYDAFIQANIKVAKKKDPRPLDIENYNKNWIVFSNLD